MPLLAVSAPEDRINLFWRSNLPNDDLAHLTTSARPTALLLHPFSLSITFLDPQFKDPILADKHNLFAFDLPSFGGSVTPLYGTRRQGAVHDDWVSAALIAAFCLELGLPPIHIFASQFTAMHAALRFAILFPEMVESLTLCGVGPLVECVTTINEL